MTDVRVFPTGLGGTLVTYFYMGRHMSARLPWSCPSVAEATRALTDMRERTGVNLPCTP